jgi:hypothetical protein
LVNVDTRTRGIDFMANVSLKLGGGNTNASLAFSLSDTELKETTALAHKLTPQVVEDRCPISKSRE